MGSRNLTRKIVKNRSNQSWAANSQDEDGFFIFKTNVWDNGGNIGLFITDWNKVLFTTAGETQFNYEASNGTDITYMAHDGTALTSIWDDFAAASVPPADLSLTNANWQVGDEITIKVRGQFDFFRIVGDCNTANHSFLPANNTPTELTSFEVIQWGHNLWRNTFFTFWGLSNIFTCSAIDAPSLGQGSNYSSGDNAYYPYAGMYMFSELPATFFTSQESIDAFFNGIGSSSDDNLGAVHNPTYERRSGVLAGCPNFTFKPPSTPLTDFYGDRNSIYVNYNTPNSIYNYYNFAESAPNKIYSFYANGTTSEAVAWNEAINRESYKDVDKLDLRNVEDAAFAFWMNLGVNLNNLGGGAKGFTNALRGLASCFYSIDGINMPKKMKHWDWSQIGKLGDYFDADGQAGGLYFVFGGATADYTWTGNTDNGIDTINGVQISNRDANSVAGTEVYYDSLLDEWEFDGLPYIGGDNEKNYEWQATFGSRTDYEGKDLLREDWVSQTKHVATFRRLFENCLSLNVDLGQWDYSGLDATKPMRFSSSVSELIGAFIKDCVGMSDENIQSLLVKWSLDASEGGLPDLNVVGSEIGKTSDTIIMGTFFDDQFNAGLRTPNQTMKDAFDIIEAKGFAITGMDYIRNF